MAALVFAIHGVEASETGTALADALIALCDDAAPSDRRSWLVFTGPINAEMGTLIDRVISLSPSSVGDIDAKKVVPSPLDGSALAMFEPVPEAPTRSLASVLIETTGGSSWTKTLVTRLLGKYTLTIASRNRDEIGALFRTEGVWSLVAQRRSDWIDLVSRHDLVITGDSFTAALANGALKPALLLGVETVFDLPACLVAEPDAIDDQLAGLDMVAIGADLLNAKRLAREQAVERLRAALDGDGA